MATDIAAKSATERGELLHSLHLQIEALRTRLTRLTDIYVDGGIERKLFEDRKLALCMEQRLLKEQLDRASSDETIIARRVDEYLELLTTLRLTYQSAVDSEKAQFIRTITSNLRLHRKDLVVELRSPFLELATTDSVRTGVPLRDNARTKAAQYLQVIIDHCKAQSKAEVDQSGLPRAA